MEFEWDHQKNRANYTKHKINFELASKVFDDPLTIYRFDRVVSVLFQPDVPPPTKGGFMKKNDIPKLDEQLEALSTMKDEDIDFSDIPEIRDFAGFERGKFFRPIKTPVTLRLDADVLEWFRHRHPKYQTAINAALRQYIHAQQ